MSVVIGGVTCEELVSNFEESGGSGGLSARKGYLCDWSDRYAVGNALLGISSSSTVGGWITISSPGRYQDSPNLMAMDVQFEGVGKPTAGANQIQFEKAIVWCTYETPVHGGEASDDPTKAHTFDQATGFTYATMRCDVGSEFVTIPGKSVFCRNAMGFGTPMEQDWGIFVALVHMSLTMYRLPYFPFRTITQLAGKLNDATFMGLETGHVRFDGAQNELTANTDGTRTQTVNYVFTYRTEATWNEAIHPNGTDGWRPVENVLNQPLYKSGDLTQIFPQGRQY